MRPLIIVYTETSGQSASHAGTAYDEFLRPSILFLMLYTCAFMAVSASAHCPSRPPSHVFSLHVALTYSRVWFMVLGSPRGRDMEKGDYNVYRDNSETDET